jgi:hypothetical protein
MDALNLLFRSARLYRNKRKVPLKKPNRDMHL